MKKMMMAFAALAAFEAAAITATKEYVDRVAPGAASNVVTKAYVESLGIDAGISAETAANIAKEVSKLSERQGFTPWNVFREGVDVTARVSQPHYDAGWGAWIVPHTPEDDSLDFDLYGTVDQTRLSWYARGTGGEVSYYGIRYPMPGYVVGDQEDKPLASIVSVSNAHIAVADLRTNMAARIDAIASRATMSTNEVCDIVTNETVVSEGGWRYSPTSVTLYGTVYVPAASGPMWDAISSKWVLVVENPEDGADVIPMAATEGFSADVLHFSYEGMESITASKDVVTRNTLGLARPSDVSNIVTKAYVEGLGIESGIQEESDPVWEGEKSSYATKSELTPVQNSVNAMWATLYGENVWLAVTNYMRQVAGTVPSLRLWEVRDGSTNLVYSSAEEIENVVTQKVYSAETNITAKIPRKAWGSYQSNGEDNPSSNTVTVVNSSRIMLTGGGEWEKTIETGAASVWVLRSSGLLTVGGDTNGYFRITDAEGNAQLEVVKTADQEVQAIAADAVFDADGNFTVTYNATGSSHPIIFCATDLANEFEGEDGSGNINSLGITVAWAKNGSGFWVATIHQDTPASKLFCHAKMILQGENLIRNSAPATFEGGLYINNTRYRIVPYSSGGKTYLTLEAWQ